LLDCGMSVSSIRKGLNWKLADVDFCLVSHEHRDHARSAQELIERGIDVYASPGTFDALGITTEARGDQRLTPGKTVPLLGGWRVTPFPVEHDAAEPCGFRIEHKGLVLVYLVDTAYCRFRFPPPIHYLLVECNFSAEVIQSNVSNGRVDTEQYKRVIQSHMSLDTLVSMLKANDLTELLAVHLLHLSAANSNARHFKETIQRATGVPVYVAKE